MIKLVQVHLCLALVLISIKIYAQKNNMVKAKDIFNLERTEVINYEDTSLDWLQGQIIFDLKNNSEYNLKAGVEYQNLNLNFQTQSQEDNLNAYEVNHLISLKIDLTKHLKNNWQANVILKPGIASNLWYDLTTKELIFPFTMSFTKEWASTVSTSRINFGIEYNTIFGGLSIYPIFYFNKRYNDHWSYKLGFPVSEIEYAVNKRTIFNMSSEFRGNLFKNSYAQNLVNGTTLIKQGSLKYRDFNLSFKLLQSLSSKMSIYAQFGYIIDSETQLKSANMSFLTDFDKKVFLNLGFKFNTN